MSVRVSPVSRLAAILMVILGIFTLAVVEVFVGLVMVILGLVLYWLLYRFSARLERELEDTQGKDS